MESLDKLTHLMRSVQTGRIVHALLFTGPDGTGKREAAKRLAKGLMCTGASRPCGVCPACKQVEAEQHPDVHYVRPERKKNAKKDDDGRTTGLIRIDQIRSLVTAVSLTPYSSNMHIAIIESADRMNQSAQNALLKTLETPTGQVMFILTAEREGSLLPTVVSRCQPLRFSPMSIEACAEALTSRGVPANEALPLAGLAQGALWRALALREDGDFMALRESALSSLEALKGDATVAVAAAPLAGNKQNAERILDIMELWARDLMAIQNGAKAFEQSDSKRLSASSLDGKRMVQAVMRARRLLAANVSWQNALETMYFQLTS